VKLTNGTDNNAAPGPIVAPGSIVTFTYLVTNTTFLPLQTIVLVDDGGPDASFTPTPVPGPNPAFNIGDVNQNNILEQTETWQYTATRIATSGQYTNTGTVTGTDVVGNVPVSDTDVDNHAAPGINLVKLTNGTDNNAAPGPIVAPGSTVTFTYLVTNTTFLPLQTIVLVDDGGPDPASPRRPSRAPTRRSTSVTSTRTTSWSRPRRGSTRRRGSPRRASTPTPARSRARASRATSRSPTPTSTTTRRRASTW
jgi:hypothetical protein